MTRLRRAPRGRRRAARLRWAVAGAGSSASPSVARCAALPGPSGAESSVMPCVDAFLGVEMKGEGGAGAAAGGGGEGDGGGGRGDGE